MKTRYKVILAGILIPVALIGYLIYWAFFDLNRLPTGDLLTSSMSPKGTYTVRAYVSDGGATTDFAVRGEVGINGTDQKPKTIYWNYHESKAKITWIDDQTVVINGHQLNVLRDTFDFRRE